ncbi:DUF4249 domain-containing protein [Mucilaginibacter sp. dw_454]|uniref:DUF4249 domain-containing protein n=1 Tax=Mucilaginibacter sp. dw_454 TaxID=2720079 RepID=UPI001BD45463|nr:DUF4249 domain-containing protein [Mucilaginibacter sp. dw_454]
MAVKYRLAILIFLSLAIASCKKVIDLKLGNAAQQLVIEGNVTDQSGPQLVTISRTLPLDSTNSFPAVTNADVEIIDRNGKVYSTIQRSPGFYYSTSFTGQPNQTYQVRAVVDGKTYRAVSTMPIKVAIDSVALSVQQIGTSPEKTIIVYYQDQPDTANQYRFVLTVNGVRVKQIFAMNDQFNDGKLVQAYLYQDDIKLKSGDHVNIEMQCIDINMYTYWYTFSQQSANGFSSTTPSNPASDFFDSPPVLGYFSAHTTERRDIIIP